MAFAKAQKDLETVEKLMQENNIPIPPNPYEKAEEGTQEEARPVGQAVSAFGG